MALSQLLPSGVGGVGGGEWLITVICILGRFSGLSVSLLLESKFVSWSKLQVEIFSKYIVEILIH